MAKSYDDSDITTLWEMDNSKFQLSEVDDFPGMISFVVESLQKKGVRVTEQDFINENVTCPNKYVMRVRGDMCHLLDLLTDSVPRSISTE